MTDSYLRSLGFASAAPAHTADRPAFHTAWRYQHTQQAQDGAVLFIEHPLGIASCRLSMLAAPLAADDIVATVSLHDRSKLEEAIAAFFSAHGGIGPSVPLLTPRNSYMPYRRQL